MLNKIVDGISEKLNEVFGDKYRIYTEQVKQGLKNPCFFVHCINPTNTQVLGNRYFRTNLFCIQFLPAEQDEKAECYNVQDALYLTLEYITVDGDLQRGTKMNGDIADGILNFFVNYDMHVYKVEEKTIMEELEITNINPKG